MALAPNPEVVGAQQTSRQPRRLEPLQVAPLPREPASDDWSAQIRAVFVRHDAERTGAIDQSKVEAVFQKLESTLVGRLLAQHPEALADFSSSGAFEYERFLAWLRDDPGEQGGGDAQELEPVDGGSTPRSKASYGYDCYDYDNALSLSRSGTKEVVPNSPPGSPYKPAGLPSGGDGDGDGDGDDVGDDRDVGGDGAVGDAGGFGGSWETAPGALVAAKASPHEGGASGGAGVAGASTMPQHHMSSDPIFTPVTPTVAPGGSSSSSSPGKQQQLERAGSGVSTPAARRGDVLPPEEHAAQEQKALLSAALVLVLWAGLVVALARAARHFEAPACTSSVEEVSVCEPCGEGLNLLPAFGEYEQSWPPALRAVLYLVGLLWLFQGVGEVCNEFMAAIEEITSSESVNLVPLENGGGQTFIELKVKVWNPTVANLTLMALGSSAPEILLSVIEVVFGGFEIGRLGTSTIVGSAAFNLFVISAVCICALDPEQTTAIEQPAVFAVTSVFSLFAYFWVLIVLDQWTPHEVTSTEGLVTLMLFPVVVACAYIADRHADVICTSRGLFGQDRQQPSLSSVSPMVTVTRMPSSKSVDLGVCQSWTQNSGTRNALKAEAYERSKTLPEELDLDLDESVPVMGTKSEKRRIACGKVNGGGLALTRAQRSDGDPDRELVFGFKKKAITVNEGDGLAIIRVVASRRPRCEVTVPWETRDGTAKSSSTTGVEDPRYEDASGELVFGPAAKLEHNIEVRVINDEKWQATEFFEVRLLRPRSESLSGQPVEVARLQEGEGITTCKVKIHDDDDPGHLCFDWPKVFARRDRFALRVARMHGVRGAISCKVRAVAKSDKWQRDFEVWFQDEEKSAVVNLVLDGNQGTTFALQLVEASVPACLRPPAEWGEEWREKYPLTCEVELLTGRRAMARSCTCALRRRGAGGQRQETKVNSWHEWRNQFSRAIYCLGDPSEQREAGYREWAKHCVCLPWKVLFACVPPPTFHQGKLAFAVALGMIGCITAIIGDMARLLGCMVGVHDYITANILVALGTSLPDTVASMIAARESPNADDAIGNIMGSNSVNVFLGLGIPWTIAAFYWEGQGATFQVPADGLGFSVLVFSCCALCCLMVLVVRRRVYGGELGGPVCAARRDSALLVMLWFVYLTLSILKTLDYL